MGRLDGKVGIVTGGGSGFGKATSLLWAKEGAKVVVADWNADTGKSVVSEIKAAGGDAVFFKVDISKAADCQKMVRTAVDNFGKLNLLFNNAGINGPFGFRTADFPEKDADELIAILFKGVFLGTKYAIPQLLKVGGGSIMHTASNCAFAGCNGLSVYSACKGAVWTFSKTVATEYARDGIRSNTISPATCRSQIHRGQVSDEGYAAIAESIPLGKLLEPDDIAYAALFLASDDSKMITGTNIMIDGGWTVRSLKI